MPGKKRNAEEEVEVDFVRGGGSGLAPVVHKQIVKDAYKEAEADLFGSGGKKGRGKKQRTAKKGGVDSDSDAEGDEEDAFFRGLSAQDKIPKFAELLKFKALSEGMKLLGAVLEITPKELILSLPHGLRGHVAFSEASDVLHSLDTNKDKESKGGKGAVSPLPALTNLFSVGQLVRCCVTGLRDGSNSNNKEKEGGSSEKARRRVDCTLLLTKVNSGLGLESLREGVAVPACVKSVEDHGYTLAFGVKGAKGFLPKKNAPREMCAGALVDVVVTAVKPGGHVITTGNAAAVAAAATKEWEGLHIGTLLPGALVTARVRNVLSDGLLTSFLTFFTGTIDPFHLGETAAGKASKKKGSGEGWAARFSEGQRLKARILFVDPATKRVGLSLQRHLVDWTAPQLPSQGQIFSAAEVRRVDPGLGVLLALKDKPSDAENNKEGDGEHVEGEEVVDASSPALGYAHLSNLTDEKVESVEDRFRVGQVVSARVIGVRTIDGLAAVSLKPSVLAQSVLNVEDLAPGLRVTGTVVKVEESALQVQLTPGLRAVVPALHMSDVVSGKAHRKFKVGQKVEGRVLRADAAAKRVAITLKPALVGSKLPVVAAVGDAVPGSKVHGVITGVQSYGVFVTFFNDLAGLIPATECGLPEGQSLTSAFVPGTVIKVRVTGADPGRNRLKLSLVSKKKAAEAADVLGGLSPGDIVDGVVTTLRKEVLAEGEEEGGLSYAEVALYAKGQASAEGAAAAEPLATGRLGAAHLSDHKSAAAVLGEALRVGSRLEGLLVLERLENIKKLRVSRKASLLDAAAAGALPGTLAEVSEGSTFPGYVASVAADSVFVRFLGELTGRAGLAQLSDTFVADPHSFYAVGQSVRAQVAQVDAAANRLGLTLKRSHCIASAGSDAGMLRSFFHDAELAAALEADEGEGEGGADADIDWGTAFAPGTAVGGQVHGQRDYGTLCDLEAHSDVVGLAAPHQAPQGEAPSEEGAAVTAAVLDYSKKDGVVDLSLRKELVDRAQAAAAAPLPTQHKKKRKNGAGAAAAAVEPLSIGDRVEATVELLKPQEGYAVVSLPAGRAPWVGFLATVDFNQPFSGGGGAPQLETGQTVTAVVAALPGDATCGRLLLALPAEAAAAKADKAARGVKGEGCKKAAKVPAGTKTTGTVDAVHALHADVTLENGSRGRIHITEAADASEGSSSESPLSRLAVGTSVDVVVLGRMQSGQGSRHGLLELSCRPAALAGSAAKPLAWDGIFKGKVLRGYAQHVDGAYLWVVFGPSVRGRAFLPSSCDSPADFTAAARRFKAGTPVQAVVLTVDAGKHALDVALGEAPPAPLEVGAEACSAVIGVGGAGVRVQLGHGVFGKVALTDVHDTPVSNALAGLKVGQCVKSVVVGEQEGEGEARAFALSLRPSQGGVCAAHKAATPPKVAPTVPTPPEELAVADLRPGQKVGGYVKAVAKSGVFVCLARGTDGRVMLRQLSDEFVKDPEAQYPAGSWVEGCILKVAGGKVDVTLRRRRPSAVLEALEEGQVVRGRVKRVENFGVFVEVDAAPGTGVGPTGLAHITELSDGFVRDVDKLFKVDQRVVGRVLKVDKTAGRLSLGLKPSYLEGLEGELEGGEGQEVADFDDELDAAMKDRDDEGSGSGEEEEGGSEEEDSDESNEGGAMDVDGEEGAEFDLDAELADDSDSSEEDSE